jgi:uncharacterized protein (TIGR02118 family)
MVKLIAFLKRKEGLTLDEFKERWLNKHVKLSSKLPGLKGYRINIATEQQPTRKDSLSNEPIYDGTAELWWDTVEEMEKSFASDIGRLSGEDADEFSSVRIHLYTEEHIVL